MNLREWFAVYRYRYTTTKSGMILRGKLESIADNSEQPYEYRTTGPFGLWSVRYQWKLSRPETETQYRIEERTWVSRSAVFFFGALVLATLLVYDIAISIGVIGRTFGILIAILGIALVLSYHQLPDPKSSPIVDAFTEEYGSLQLRFVPTAAVVAAAIGIALLINVSTTLSAVVTLTAYYPFSNRLSPLLRDKIDKFDHAIRRLPSVSSVYLATCLLVVFTVYAYTALLGDITAVRTAQYVPGLSIGTSIGQVGAAIVFYCTVYYLLLDANHARREFIEQGRTTDNPTLLLLFGVIVLVASVILWLVLLSWLETAIWLHGYTVRPWVVLATAATGVGLAYYVVGGIYQWARLGSLLWKHKRATTTDHDIDTAGLDVEVRVRDSDTVAAGAASNGLQDYVVVTSGLVDVLEPDELESVLAHEQAHVQHGEAKIGFVLAAVSPLLLVGKNVLYSLLDFRARELTADRYAAKRTDPATLTRALEKLRRYEVDRQMGSQANVLPSMTSDDAPERVENRLERAFGYFYGSFALTDVHPDIEERLEKIDGLRCDQKMGNETVWVTDGSR